MDIIYNISMPDLHLFYEGLLSPQIHLSFIFVMNEIEQDIYIYNLIFNQIIIIYS